MGINYTLLDNRYKKPGELMFRKINIIEKYFKGGDALLDVGCGTGELLFRLKDKYHTLSGLDPDKNSINFSKERLEKYHNVKLFHLEFEEFVSKKNSFDTIACLDVLEHTQNPSKIVSKCCDLLKPGGQLIVSMPNWHDIIWSGLFKLNKLHLHTHTPYGWMKIIKRAGFKINYYRSIKFPFLNSDFIPKHLPLLGMGIIINATKK